MELPQDGMVIYEYPCDTSKEKGVYRYMATAFTGEGECPLELHLSMNGSCATRRVYMTVLQPNISNYNG